MAFLGKAMGMLAKKKLGLPFLNHKHLCINNINKTIGFC